MSYGHDEGPVYYREIQKNAYLKRIPNETSGSKLRPLGHKKPPLKPMWTLFCVHNGRSPYLEQYPLAESPGARAHQPVWRACLRSARHVTASVTPRAGNEYDFLVDTDQGPVRMLAPDWESMQEWVTTLRNKLHELRILSKGENVYCAAPAAPAPRPPARDPTSPLPPPPPGPPDRVPGVELSTPPSRAPPPEAAPPAPPSPLAPPAPAPAAPVDISSWEEPPAPHLPSTSAGTTHEKLESKKSVAKICGQNICLDDSILKRSASDSSDEEFHHQDAPEYRQTLVVADEGLPPERQSDLASNVTVIEVSNKPPHSAPPDASPAFTYPQPQQFVNIVNTEVNVNSENGYGTVFNDSDYGHLSLTTTTVNLTDVTPEPVKVTAKDGVYERLCLASTSNESVTKIKRLERVRKSSLPNIDLCNTESTYEYLYPSQGGPRNVTVTVNNDIERDSSQDVSQRSEIQSDVSRIQNIEERNSNTVTVSGNLSFNARVLRANVERSHSQNAYDSAPRTSDNVCRRVQNGSPKRDNKNEKESHQAKPIWKRGLTELSLLTRLRLAPRRQSPTRDDHDRSATSPVRVVHRSRTEARVNSTRRRSSSLSNGASPPSGLVPALVPLRRGQAAALQAEQRRRAALPAALPAHPPPILAEHDKRIWIAWWGPGGARVGGRAGDALVAARAQAPRDLAHARRLLRGTHTHTIDILFHRVPLGKMYILTKRDQESIGIRLDSECTIIGIEPGSPAARAGLATGVAVTEVNNRSINLLKGGEEEMNRLSLHGTEVSILIQPAALVKKLRAAIKANKALISIR